MENLPETKKRLVADFNLDHTGGWRGRVKQNENDWKFPYEIVPYDTYIIFEEHLGAILFARNISKNINTV